MSLIYFNPYQFGVAGPAYDADAQAYITAVETEDGQALEVGVKDAINDFVVGCKDDGIWNAIKACCILAGARTLTGALESLVGNAPTNFNFVQADYDRKTGLLGNGSTKYLNLNRNNNADPQNDRHFSVYGSWPATVPTRYMILDGVAFSSGGSGFSLETTTTIGANIASSSAAHPNPNGVTGLIALSRNSSAEYSYLTPVFFSVYSRASAPLLDQDYNLYRRAINNTAHAPVRLAFYSIGEYLDIALLNARVNTLISAIGAAIP